jgi:hypothetical protein
MILVSFKKLYTNQQFEMKNLGSLNYFLIWEVFYDFDGYYHSLANVKFCC